MCGFVGFEYSEKTNNKAPIEFEIKDIRSYFPVFFIRSKDMKQAIPANPEGINLEGVKLIMFNTLINNIASVT